MISGNYACPFGMKAGLKKNGINIMCCHVWKIRIVWGGNKT